MKRLSIIFLILTGIVFMASMNAFRTSSPEFTNFYYYQGEKFYYDHQPGMIFIKFENDQNVNISKQILSKYSEIDNNISITGEKNVIAKLKYNLTEDKVLALYDKLEQDEEISSAGPVYTPSGYDDGKTYFGLTDEFIAQFRNDMTKDQIFAINAENNVEVIKELELSGGPTYLLKVTNASMTSSIDMANKYYERGLTNYSEPDLYCTNTLTDTTNDQFFWNQWSIRNLGNNVPSNPPNVIADADMDVDSAWMVTKGDSTIKIAVVDTGTDTNHVDLVGNMTHGLGWDCASNDPWPYDVGGHGTSCTGIAAASGNNSIGIAGIAYKCKIIPIRAVYSSGATPYHAYVCAFERAWQAGSDVITNSWGIIGGASSALDNAISDAARFGRNGKGCVITFASGNENSTAMRYPSRTHPDILVIGGLAPCNKRKSNTDGCSGESWGASYGWNLDVVAPCVKIYATSMNNNYTSSFNGTSSATPNAAGVCALILSANPNLTRKEVESYISLTAEKVGPYTYDSLKTYGAWHQEMGYGRINARLALEMALTGIDKSAPLIFHDVEQISSSDSLARVVNAIIKDNRKLATGTNAPRLYYNVNNGSFNFVNASVILGDTFKFTIPGQPTNSIIEYYFAAQDTVTPANLTTLPIGGSGISPPGTTPPVQRFTYTIGKIKVALNTTRNVFIPDLQTIYDTIVIQPFGNNAIMDVDVKVNISHRYAGDVDMFLKKGSIQSELSTDNGGTSTGFFNTIFDDEATIPITQSGQNPYNGRYRPETYLNVFDGNVPEGTWILQIADDGSSTPGLLDKWQLIITYQTIIGGIEQHIIPSSYNLYQNYPNPFNPVTVIQYDVPKSSDVSIIVYDLTGKVVSELVKGNVQQGRHEIKFDASQFASGIYFYRMQAGDFTAVNKMIILK